MRLAAPIWNDKISPVLDTAANLFVLESGVTESATHFEIYPVEMSISSRCSLLKDLGIELIICGAVSRQFSRMLTASGIRIVSGISGPVEAVVEAYLENKLAVSGFFLPGQAGTKRETCI